MSMYRVRCVQCGEAMNVRENGKCPKCGAAVETEQPAAIQLYRMGSPIGIAMGFGIYINGQPYGHIGNKQSVRIPLPYGTYTVHVTAGMNRRCKDMTVTLSPDNPLACGKVDMEMGLLVNKLVVLPSKPESMPPMD